MESQADPNRHFSITLPAFAVDRLDRMAARRGTRRSAVVREAVLDWLARQPPEQEQPYDIGLDADTEQ